MFFDLKASRVLLYIIALVPVILSFIPAVSSQYVFICSIISFGLSLLNESLTSFLNEYKKKAVMEYQLYETGIAGTEFSKIEYDRESTNELNELAIRKGLPQMRGKDAFYDINVPEDIPDEYAYLYLCRRAAATTKFLLSRIFYIYLFLLILIAVGFIVAVFFKNETIEYLTLLITFYPVISPIIKACGKCKECMRDCTKMCADIDNYFADGDISLERLARMHYYVQYIEFEMLTNRPTIYTVFKKLFNKGVLDLEEGVTIRFERAIVELKGKSMMQKGIIASPKGRTLITKVDYDLDDLKKIAKDSKQKKKAKPDVAAKTETTGKSEPNNKTEPVKKAETPRKTETAKSTTTRSTTPKTTTKSTAAKSTPKKKTTKK